MTKDFDPLNEFPLHSEDFGEGMLYIYNIYTDLY